MTGIDETRLSDLLAESVTRALQSSAHEDRLKAVVHEAVNHTLVSLGFDIEEPKEMRKDMTHLRTWRETTESVKNKTTLAIVGILVSGILAAIWVGIKELVHK